MIHPASYVAPALALLLGSALPALAQPPKPVTATALLTDANGKSAGKVVLSVDRSAPTASIKGMVEATGLTPGAHGMHIHAVGKCDGTAFAGAGGHLNPENRQHGLANPMGAHLGDLPPLTAGSDGSAHQSFTLKANLAAILDEDGASFVIHADADDMRTDPSGNSGARLLCGVFKKD